MAHFARTASICAASCLALFALPAPAAQPRETHHERLTAMLDRHAAMVPGPAREQLALAIDRFAGQRYATVSRLYWHQDLETAKAAAAAQQRPILHLRMLGRLDEDLSCANSRFFRTLLYANTETARFLRDNFVLVWTSERPVPKVTIDFGDGRKIERTTTGNSAHYVMDEHGNVLDVLPGLYAPVVFRAELAKSLVLARSVRGKPADERVRAVVAHHTRELEATARRFSKLAGTQYIARRGRLLRSSELGTGALEAAQRATYAKMVIEVPDLRTIGIDAGTIDRGDVAQWAAIGQQLWNIGLAKPAALFDRASTALVAKLRGGDDAAVIARLEQLVLADTALGDLQLRQQIRMHLAATKQLAFAPLNDWIYARVFHTPKSDPWLGLRETTEFTGLPADGVVMP